MTPFEIIVIALLSIIAVATWRQFVNTEKRLSELYDRIDNAALGMNTKLGSIVADVCDKITPDLELISTDVPVIREYLNNTQQSVDEIKILLGSLVNLRFNEEGLKSGIPAPTHFPQCATPDGICTNPYGDCINCPKRGEGGNYGTCTSATTGIETTNNKEG